MNLRQIQIHESNTLIYESKGAELKLRFMKLSLHTCQIYHEIYESKVRFITGKIHESKAQSKVGFMNLSLDS